MRVKLVASLLVLCIAFSIGSVQAQTGEDNTSQMGNSTAERKKITSTLANKTIYVSQAPGGTVRWILPGERRLDPSIFGTPQAPLGFEPDIGVPVEDRNVNENGTAFTTTKSQTPFSDNFTAINGSFYMNLIDRTPVDVNLSRDAATAEFNFTDPTGNTRYRVILTNITRVGQVHPVFGGVLIDGIAHGRTAIDTRLEPTSYVYGAVWGVGELYINDTLVSENRVIHAMATERLRSYDQQGYRLLVDKELPHRGIQAHLVLLDRVIAANGTLQKEPVPTNFTLPNGQEQSFIHIAYDNPQLEGLRILNFYNASMNMTELAGIVGNMTGNQTGNMTGNQTGNMTEAQTGNMTETQTGTTGTQTQNMTMTQTGTTTGTQTGNMSGTQAETTGSQEQTGMSGESQAVSTGEQAGTVTEGSQMGQ